MDSSTIIAVAGLVMTAIAGLGGVWLGHFLQRRAAREQYKQELLCARLATVEEAMNLMGDFIHVAQAACYGLPIVKDESASRRKALRLQDIRMQAWNNICLIGSERLKKNWQKLSIVYGEWEEHGTISKGKEPEAQQAQIDLIKELDEIRLQETLPRNQLCRDKKG